MSDKDLTIIDKSSEIGLNLGGEGRDVWLENGWFFNFRGEEPSE
jgi:hypothetical protein